MPPSTNGFVGFMKVGMIPINISRWHLCDLKTGYVSKLGASEAILTYIIGVMGTPETLSVFKVHHASLT